MMKFSNIGIVSLLVLLNFSLSAQENSFVQIEQLLQEGRAQEALHLLEKIQVKNQPEYLNFIGKAHLLKGRSGLALEKFMEVESLATINDKLRADNYSDIAVSYWATGNTTLSLQYHLKALDIRTKTNDVERMAASFNDIGLVYSANNPSLALQYYHKALKIYESLNDKEDRATAYINIGIAHRNMSESIQAIDNLENALALREEIYGEGHPSEAFVYSNLGLVHADLEEHDVAMEYQEMALEIYQKQYGKTHPEIANTYNLIGKIYRDKGMYKSAINQYQMAINANIPNANVTDIYSNPQLGKQYNADILLSTLYQKAITFEEWHSAHSLKIKDMAMALKTLELCDTLVDQIRHLRQNEQDKVALGEQASNIFEAAVRVAIKMGDISWNKNRFYKKAFEFAEKSKSAVLQEAIDDAKAKQYAGIPQNLLSEEQELKAELAYYERKLADKPTEQMETEYRNKIFELSSSYRSFVQMLEKDYPQYYELKFMKSKSALAPLQPLINNNQAVLSYFKASSTNQLYVFYISQSKFKVSTVTLDDKFDQLLSGFRNAIYYKAEQTYLNTGYELYNLLIPFRLNASIKHLTIIPSGRIATIPFEALLTGPVESNHLGNTSLPYLIKKVGVSYQYSAELNTANLNSERSNDIDISLIAPVSFARLGMSDLPGTEKEVNEISSLFPDASSVSIYLQDKATKDIFANGKTSKSSYLHLATHGVVDEMKPERSAICLTPDIKNSGYMYSGDIYNLNLDVDLVTLSACETGLGKISKGEGIIGLSRALIYAGATNMVVSLWSVSDNSTAVLMTEFYKHILTGDDYTTALQKARISLINTSDYSAPYYWAPFVLIGN